MRRALLFLCVAGCDGVISEPVAKPPPVAGVPPSAGGGSEPPVSPPVPVDPTACTVEVGPAPLRRLTRFEYDNTVRDLLGDDTHPSAGLPADVLSQGFVNQAAAQDATIELVQAQATVADAIAARAAQRLAMLEGGCRPQVDGVAGCRTRLLDQLARRAFRRPLTQAEKDRFGAVYDAGITATTVPEVAAEWLLSALLQSSEFLYRPELGGASLGGGRVALSGYEVASRLSYALWGSMPDDALFAAAAAGRLDTADGLAVEARRLVADPRTRAVARDFHTWWLWLYKLDNLEKASPQFTPALAAAMKEEVLRFAEQAMFDHDLGTLMTGTASFVNQPLAQLYGLTGITGDTLRPTDLSSTPRRGVLGLGGVLALTGPGSSTSPVQRGKFVRLQLLCNTLPAPPPNVDTTPPVPTATTTTRQRYEAHTQGSCAGCHQLMDPVGFGLEHFDTTGKWRDTENGFAIDDRGKIVGSRSTNGEFQGEAQLADLLKGSAEVRQCMTQQWFRYALGRSATSVDSCTLAKLDAQAAAAGGGLPALLVALVSTDAFRTRIQVVPGQ